MTLQVTTIERVKRAGITDIDLNDTTYDQPLTGLIAEVSRQFEQYIGRPLLSETVTEVQDADRFQESLWLDRPPVTSITSIKMRSALSTAFADVTALATTSFDFNATTGRIVLGLDLLAGVRSVEIIYVGGFAATTTALVSSYPDIVNAAERQVAEMWRRRMSPDRASESINGVTSTTQMAVRLLPSVKETLFGYKRMRLV